MSSALLLSGGMDSISLAWWRRPDFAFTIDYGQLAGQAEIAASSAICKRLGLVHHVLSIDVRALGSGDMAGTAPSAFAPATDWWPYRNQFLITIVAMKAVALGITELMVGTVASDGSHRDGTLEFVHKADALLACQEGELRVHAPAIQMSTVELIRKSGIPMSELAWAHSCHKANVACGNCRGCNKYFEVLHELADGKTCVS